MKCPNCGKEVSEDIKFCPRCGQRLKKGFTPEERQKYIEKLKTSIEEEKPAKKTKMKKKLLIGLASVIGIFILIGIIAIVTAPEEQPTQILPPAETTEPVSPPTTPEKPALTIAEQAYVNAVGDQVTTVGKAFTNFSSLLQNPKYGDDEWTLQVAVQLTTIRLVYDEAMELDPPSSMAEIHLKYTGGMKAYNDMTYLFSRGVDELDPNLIDQAVTKMETGERLINEATELMLEFSEPHATAPAEATKPETEWYIGGTLHKATIAEWHKATYANRLATCADFVVTANREEAERDFSTVKPKAIELEKCITEATKDIPEIQHHQVAEYAASCTILLGYKK